MLLALFGFCMAWAYDAPTWVWLVGMGCAVIHFIKYWKEVDL